LFLPGACEFIFCISQRRWMHADGPYPATVWSHTCTIKKDNCPVAFIIPFKRNFRQHLTVRPPCKRNFRQLIPVRLRWQWCIYAEFFIFGI